MTKRIRTSRSLTYDDIERIKGQESWKGGRFWLWPSRADIGDDLENQSWDLWNLPKNEDAAIERLLKLFRNIEPVSVVLRFVDPKNYRILSPPVEKLLELPPSRSRSAKYTRYVRCLRGIRRRRGFETAAQVDMALWVLQLGVIEERLVGCRDLAEQFHSDKELRSIRVGNLTKALFESMSRPDLAEALLTTNHELASEMAGIEFERAVRFLTDAADEDLSELVNRYCGSSDLSHNQQVRWREAVKTRNRAVHKNPPPRDDQARRLIETMRAAVVRCDRAHS